MENKIYRTEGTVEEKISESFYLVKIEKGIVRKVRLSAKLRMHYKEISINAKVHVELPRDKNKEGRFLSATDFKINGWIGWTEEYEPKTNSLL